MGEHKPSKIFLIFNLVYVAAEKGHSTIGKSFTRTMNQVNIVKQSSF